MLTASQKARVFSLNYSFLNIGWTIGPPIGTLLVMYSLQLPFWLAAFCAALPLGFIHFFVQKSVALDTAEEKMPWQPSVLLKDRALFWYTLSGLLASYVADRSRPAFRNTFWPRMRTVISPKRWSPWYYPSTPPSW